MHIPREPEGMLAAVACEGVVRSENVSGRGFSGTAYAKDPSWTADFACFAGLPAGGNTGTGWTAPPTPAARGHRIAKEGITLGPPAVKEPAGKRLWRAR